MYVYFPNPPTASAFPPQPPSAPSAEVALTSTFDLSGISPEVIRQVREEYLRAQQSSQPLAPQPNSPAPTPPPYDSRPALKTDDGGTATNGQNSTTKPKLAPSGPIKGILKKRPSEASDPSRPITAIEESRRPVASVTLTRAAEGMDMAVLARLDEMAVEGRVFDMALRENQLSADREVIIERHKAELDNLLAKLLGILIYGLFDYDQLRELVGLVNMSEVEAFEAKASTELRTLDERIIAEIDREVGKQQTALLKMGVPSFEVTSDPEKIKMQMKVLEVLVEMIGG
ncbi:hypothetical protein BC937DRAFT_89523 [Endogone sp. FLAS-F59071]|nr:hypothetical protein BC937DRAFT_89523 [Endogone sp. FLAS-F59071]|eukprot:RUS17755.1 hypothetical protein BC937DRAFT_89523 [Endogone sp. FLAS-F59071]